MYKKSVTEKKFTIGEVSKIFGISVYSLRHYHKIKLITPAYIDPDTGYRYYLFEQFQFISRLKYLRSIGLSLDQIKEIFNTGNVNVFKEKLDKLLKEKENELEEIKEVISKINWMESYYSFSENHNLKNILYKKKFPKRFLLTSCRNKNMTIEEMDIDLHKKLNSKKFKDIYYKRHFGFVLDFDSLIKGEFSPKCETVLIDKTAACKSKNILVLPEGDYLCYCAKIITENFDVTPIVDYIQKNTSMTPEIAIAFEFENHLKEYYNAIYEIQILFNSVK